MEKRPRIDRVIDGFWSAVDWATDRKKAIKESKEASAERRRLSRNAAKPAPPPATLDTLADDIARQRERRAMIEAAGGPVDALATLGREVASGAAEGIADKAEAVKSRIQRAREAKSAKAAQKAAAAPELPVCPACDEAYEPPALFCPACHEPLIHAGRMIILCMLTLAAVCFFSAEMFRRELEWPWPIYIFFSACFLLLNAVLLKGATRIAWTAFFWGLAFMGGGLFVFYFGEGAAREFVLDGANTFGKTLSVEPVALAIFVGTLLAGAIILFVWMTNRYKMTQSYRTIILFTALGALALKYIYLGAIKYKPVADSLGFAEPELILEALEIVSLNLLRVLGAEMLVFSMIKAHSPAAVAFAARKARPRPRSGARRSGMDAIIDQFYLFSLLLANSATRFYLQVYHGFATLGAEIKALALCAADFAWTILRDLAIPAGSLVAAAAAIHALAIGAGNYIVSHRALDLLPVVGAAVCGLGAQLLFLSSKGRLAPSRLLASQVFLSLWFAPYALILFLFLSVSLWAAGRLITRWDDRAEIAYQLGPMTAAAILLLVVALGVAVYKRHTAPVEDEGTDMTDATDASDESAGQ